jgi:hypothetical protein
MVLLIHYNLLNLNQYKENLRQNLMKFLDFVEPQSAILPFSLESLRPVWHCA